MTDQENLALSTSPFLINHLGGTEKIINDWELKNIKVGIVMLNCAGGSFAQVYRNIDKSHKKYTINTSLPEKGGCKPNRLTVLSQAVFIMIAGLVRPSQGLRCEWGSNGFGLRLSDFTLEQIAYKPNSGKGCDRHDAKYHV